QAVSWVLAQSKKWHGAARLVLLSLANHTDAEGRAWPGIKTIAEEAGCSDRTVQRALRQLQKDKVIGAEERWSEAGGQRSTCYRMSEFVVSRRVDDLSLFGEGDILSPPGDRTPGGRVTKRHQGGDTGVTRGGVISSPGISLEPSVEPSQEPL